jgi:hypothetical protein
LPAAAIVNRDAIKKAAEDQLTGLWMQSYTDKQKVIPPSPSNQGGLLAFPHQQTVNPQP